LFEILSDIGGLCFILYIFFNMWMEAICDYCFHLEISKYLFIESQQDGIDIKT